MTQRRIIQRYGKLPLSFEANEGQTDRRVKFLSRGSGYSLFLTSDSAVLTLRNPVDTKKQSGKLGALDRSSSPGERQITSRSILRMRLVGANRKARIAGEHELPGKSNCFIGNDPKKWRTNLPNYAKVRYGGVYPGINLVYYGNQGQLEYDFVVAPGADPKAIDLRFAGANRIGVERATGDLLLRTGDHLVRLRKPVVYQSSRARCPGSRQKVEGHYKVDRSRLSFEIGSYDRSRPLVIDPALSYSTYLGGSATDFAASVAVDSSGDAYMTGSTASTAFPVTVGAYQTAFAGGSYDSFVTKVNPAGTFAIYSTYLGGSSQDIGSGITVDSLGDAYIGGSTLSANFPITPGAFQTVCGGCGNGEDDAFVAELNPTGSSLVYSTYLGGSGSDVGYAIALDSSMNAYVTGFTYSTDFPITPDAFQPTPGGNGDAYVAELNGNGSALVYSTYLGGSNSDQGVAIALDGSGNAYITGQTCSTDFPITPGAFQTRYGGGGCDPGDAFVAKVTPGSSELGYATYFGWQ